MLIFFGCSRVSDIKTLDAYKIANLEGIHFSVLYNIIGAPNTNYIDIYSHTDYNFYNYIGYSYGRFYIQEGFSNFGLGMSYSCEIKIKTDKKIC